MYHQWQINTLWIWSTGGMTVTAKLKYSKKNPSQCHSFHHKHQTLPWDWTWAPISHSLGPINRSKQKCTPLGSLHGAILYLLTRPQKIKLLSVDDNINTSTVWVHPENGSDVWYECLKICKTCALLGYYTALCGNCLPTFLDNVSVQSSRVKSPSTGI
jgi:hypothetical protein